MLMHGLRPEGLRPSTPREDRFRGPLVHARRNQFPHTSSEIGANARESGRSMPNDPLRLATLERHICSKKGISSPERRPVTALHANPDSQHERSDIDTVAL